MYYRKSNSRHRVEWNPANESTAIQALIETSDTGVSAENEVLRKKSNSVEMLQKASKSGIKLSLSKN